MNLKSWGQRFEALKTRICVNEMNFVSMKWILRGRNENCVNDANTRPGYASTHSLTHRRISGLRFCVIDAYLGRFQRLRRGETPAEQVQDHLAQDFQMRQPNNKQNSKSPKAITKNKVWYFFQVTNSPVGSHNHPLGGGLCVNALMDVSMRWRKPGYALTRTRICVDALRQRVDAMNFAWTQWILRGRNDFCVDEMNFASMERSCTIGGHRSDRYFNMYTFGGAHAPITLRTTGACQTNKNCKKRKLLVCSWRRKSKFGVLINFWCRQSRFLIFGVDNRK